MPKPKTFQPGERVLYVPPHVDGPGHTCPQAGTVQECRQTGVLVEYQNDDSPVAKLTKRRNLHHIDDSLPF